MEKIKKKIKFPTSIQKTDSQHFKTKITVYKRLQTLTYVSIRLTYE